MALTMTIDATRKRPASFKPDETQTSWSLTARNTVSYEIKLADGLLDLKNPTLASAGAEGGPVPQRRVIVIDKVVDELYGERIHRYFADWSISTEILPVDASEEEKSLESVLAVTRAFGTFGLSRRSEPVIAIGGGVLLDIVGMACNLFRRGVPYVRIPTTLMGLIDAGIGAKTGVNFEDHKNRLGTYFAPRAAYLDRSFLGTLDDRNIANGIAEIIKIALIKDKKLFERMEACMDCMIPDRMTGSPCYDFIIERAVAGMLEELEPNLWEADLERLVDYGHTWGPTLEMAALPDLLHGESVAIDMAYSLIIAEQRGLISTDERQRGLDLMRGLDLPIHHPQCTPELMMTAMADTKKHRDGLQRTPLTHGIGNAFFVNDLTEDEMTRACRTLEALACDGAYPSAMMSDSSVPVPVLDCA